CELDQMREVPFVRKADDLALATSHLAQSSSASRLTACAVGLLLTQCRERPGRYGEPRRFDTMPSRPSLHAWHTASPSVSLIKVLYCFHQRNDVSKCEVAHTSLPIRPLKVRQLVLGPVLVPRYRSLRGYNGTETRTGWASGCLRDAHVCLRDSSCGGGHPSGHGGPQFGSAELLTDLPPPTFGFVLRAPTCASMRSYSVCWVWCSQPRSYW